MNSNNSNLHGLAARMEAMRPSIVKKNIRTHIGQLLASRRLVRYGLVGLNVALLIGIAWFTLGPTHEGQPLGRQGVIAAANSSATDPLDQLSSVDIAEQAALAVGLPEALDVVNQAVTANTEQAVLSESFVINKPQLVSTPFKSRKDIKEYETVGGDTVASVAAKFGVTSDSIIWSNGLRGNALNPGIKLLIPPRNGIVYTVAAGDTLESLSRKFRANQELLVAFNDIELTGLKTGERILIPDGLQPVATGRPVAGLVWGSGNGYIYGFCTWHAANRRIATGNPLPSNLGHASSWYRNAVANGMSVGDKPRAGAVLWHVNTRIAGGLGHVGYVERMNDDGSILVSDMNYPRWGGVTYRTIQPSEFGEYRFIY